MVTAQNPNIEIDGKTFSLSDLSDKPNRKYESLK